MAKDNEQSGSGFKVTDRRLFDEQGELRPEAVELKSAEVPSKPAPAQPRAEEKKRTPDPPKEKEPHEARRTGDSLRTLIGMLFQQAQIALGDLPVQGRSMQDLEFARQVIDMINALQEKTKGNLSAEEAQVLQSVVYELRMSFLGKSKNLKL
jgi:hypothetical protein